MASIREEICGGKRRCADSLRVGKDQNGLLQQVFEFVLLEPFYDFGDILRAIARAEEDGVGGFDEDKIANSDGSDEFFWTPEIISTGVEGEGWAGGNVCCGMGGEQFENGVPGADIAPADFCGDD